MPSHNVEQARLQISPTLLKEALNYWFRLRQRKRQEDIFNDAEDTIDPIAGNSGEDALPKATRKARVKRERGEVKE